ncbi:protein phosphatase 2C domain-containing protein [Actinacidiphila epipremni]|uniref:Protein phosphatase 2C domain-containing protein n=1 Tax=Actinacidiphila epipremni TaxID=2053013 RepID=A0ABX0ZNV5_9ACTN|nr:protein phosphatase 2C domain-containing protein [Actinacidiphila epipremni]NJP43283.1 protein phosphatase 2C domain-containing protein [Actinacidiphila epipremni]
MNAAPGTGAAPWVTAAASVLGTDHARTATDCQDGFRVRRSGGEPLILVAADGGGRAHLAGAASALAATLAADEAHDRLPADRGSWGAAEGTAGWSAYLDEVVRAVVGKFAAVAQACSTALGDPQDYGPAQWGTTLTVVVADPPWLVAAAVGDGFVVTRCGDAQFDLLLPPDDDPAAPDEPADPTAGDTTTEATTDPTDPTDATDPGNDAPFVPEEPGRTVFLLSPHAADRSRRLVARLPDLTGIAVSTDGLRQVGLMSQRARATAPYDAFFAPLFGHADKAGAGDTFLARFLAAERLCALTGDDKTLLVAVARP